MQLSQKIQEDKVQFIRNLNFSNAIKMADTKWYLLSGYIVDA